MKNYHVTTSGDLIVPECTRRKLTDEAQQSANAKRKKTRISNKMKKELGILQARLRIVFNDCKKYLDKRNMSLLQALLDHNAGLNPGDQWDIWILIEDLAEMKVLIADSKFRTARHERNDD
jgi:hypothetical protein